jgi:hypothetical protein
LIQIGFRPERWPVRFADLARAAKTAPFISILLAHYRPGVHIVGEQSQVVVDRTHGRTLRTNSQPLRTLPQLRALVPVAFTPDSAITRYAHTGRSERMLLETSHV